VKHLVGLVKQTKLNGHGTSLYQDTAKLNLINNTVDVCSFIAGTSNDLLLNSMTRKLKMLYME